MQVIQVEPKVLTIPQVAQALGLCRAKVYELIAKEGLPVVRFGRAVRVRPAALERWLAERERQCSL